MIFRTNQFLGFSIEQYLNVQKLNTIRKTVALPSSDKMVVGHLQQNKF